MRGFPPPLNSRFPLSLSFSLRSPFHSALHLACGRRRRKGGDGGKAMGVVGWGIAGRPLLRIGSFMKIDLAPPSLDRRYPRSCLSLNSLSLSLIFLSLARNFGEGGKTNFILICPYPQGHPYLSAVKFSMKH